MSYLDIRLHNGNTIRYDYNMIKEPIWAGEYVKLIDSTRLSPDGMHYRDLVVSDKDNSEGIALQNYNPCPYGIFILEEF